MSSLLDSASWRERSSARNIAIIVLLMAVLSPSLTWILNELGLHVNDTTKALIYLLLTILTSSFTPVWLSLYVAIENYVLLSYFFAGETRSIHLNTLDDLMTLAVFILASLVSSVLLRELRERDRKLARLQQIEQADQLKKALLTAVSHDLRGPLATAKAAVSSLINPKMQWSNDQQGEFLSTANDSLAKLNHLIENLLDMSRIQGGVIQVASEEVDLTDAISAAIKDYRATGRTFEISIAEDAEVALGDAVLVERVIENIVENAVKFDKSSTAIAISVARTGNDVVVKVIDHGVGISELDMERVREPFQRLGDRNATKGVGLGLAVVDGFLQLLNGRMDFSPTPGGGLTVELHFPAGAYER